jgi:hypothetical protein
MKVMIIFLCNFVAQYKDQEWQKETRMYKFNICTCISCHSGYENRGASEWVSKSSFLSWCKCYCKQDSKKKKKKAPRRPKWRLLSGGAGTGIDSFDGGDVATTEPGAHQTQQWRDACYLSARSQSSQRPGQLGARLTSVREYHLWRGFVRVVGFSSASSVAGFYRNSSVKQCFLLVVALSATSCLLLDLAAILLNSVARTVNMTWGLLRLRMEKASRYGG